jgi:hypothetical protein
LRSYASAFESAAGRVEPESAIKAGETGEDGVILERESTSPEYIREITFVRSQDKVSKLFAT